MRFELNMGTVSKILDPINPRLRSALKMYLDQYPSEFFGAIFSGGIDTEGGGVAIAGGTHLFPVFIRPNGRIQISDPVRVPEVEQSALCIYWLTTNDEISGGFEYKNIAMKVEIHLSNFFRPLGRYSIYNLIFDVDHEDPSFDQLKNGYIGITKRSPIKRFKEHQIKAQRGSGSIVHRAWSALAASGVEYFPSFSVFGTGYADIESVYAAEEKWVDKLTLAPRGLNAIPGGMAGIKMMHELRLLNSTSQVSPEKRDDILDKFLMSSPSGGGAKITHFRSGHIRKLAVERITWVKSCWVNLPESIAA